MMLRSRKHDLVVGGEPENARHEVERIGRVVSEHDLRG
jgi:hypothetical protein